MKKLAIIGAAYYQRPLYIKAKEMGLYVLGFAWKDGAVCAELADEYYDISVVEKEHWDLDHGWGGDIIVSLRRLC